MKNLIKVLKKNSDNYCNICQKEFKKLDKLIKYNKHFKFEVLKDYQYDYIHIQNVECK